MIININKVQLHGAMMFMKISMILLCLIEHSWLFLPCWHSSSSIFIRLVETFAFIIKLEQVLHLWIGNDKS